MKKRTDSGIPVGGRIVLIIFTYILITGIAQYIGAIVAGIPSPTKKIIENLSLRQILILQLFTFFSTILVVFFFRKYVDGKSIMSIGLSLRNRASDLLSGFFIALFIMGGGFLILYFGKYIQILNVQLHFSKILLNFFILFLAAFEEEIFIRGYILNNLMDSTNKYIALIISSIIFSLFHILNFDISWFSLINLFLAGILFGIIYLFTKNLWLPISLHLFWNFFQGPVFGFSVSGQKFPPVFTINELGSSFINGGKFGFEGSVLCTIALILTILLAFLFYKNRFKINIPIRQ